MTDNYDGLTPDYGGLVPDIDDTFAYMGATLIAASAFLLGLVAGAALTAWAVLR
jgi:hypothetical protein